ncbi:MAG: hypothetical protein OI860_00530 (plasmid) [Candidatus Methanoperedens sp.]|uniref:hypothetical protein n=1 Tax=Candidatus Methanoperedens sp. BLZ2 TaxID=2035255 RepID=UPI000BE2EED5|nr:hypothetical protein [Candidatus Methanoperedens sp. BLZ2]KAB2945289.1 MAG: hypothetical protein F9K14_11685 [Candidatus Methanoperedens sp.]MBZ0175565.1 hypothetical protein [Candidatus Methanoperedens nitroreducens]WAH95160.1 MAG: hypothetical protein OI863_00785 [Candidatus Methanoperedens sp.]WAM22280.1 MAG: hypothetical protein OI860_00530 [Candidatus Methanoperedens sp.]
MKIEIIIIGMLVVSLSGCVNANIYPGTFKLSVPPNQTLELRDDGTYLLIPADVKYTEKGSYIKKGPKIEFTDALGFTEIMTITDKGLLAANGNLWVRVPKS